jgi:hypothetical protein
MPLVLILGGVAVLAVGLGVFLTHTASPAPAAPLTGVPGSYPLDNAQDVEPKQAGVVNAGASVQDVKTDGTSERGAVETADRFIPSAPAVIVAIVEPENPFPDEQLYDPSLDPRDVVETVGTVKMWTIDESVTPRDLSMGPDVLPSEQLERLG